MNTEFSIRMVCAEEAETIYRIMKESYEQLENKDVFVCEDLESVKACMEGKGFAVAACDPEGIIAAFLLVRYPGDAEDNLGRDIGLEEAELSKAAHMESCVVRPVYRGNHLERRLLCYAEECMDKKRFRHLMATVSPENPASYKSMEACGYRLMMTKEKYGGFLRRIYYKCSDSGK